jgi:organic radical activating enzyme
VATVTGPDTLPVAEVFGPTFQGEGPSTGQTAYFVRLGGCNLTCDRCDTPFTWDARRYNLRDQLTPLTARQINDRLAAIGADTCWSSGEHMVVITGGEPLMYQDRSGFGLLVSSMDCPVEIETNGTIAPAEWLRNQGHVRFNVSPKLAGPMSIDPEHRRIVPSALASFVDLAVRGQAVFKIVVTSDEDVKVAVDLTDGYGIPRRAVWVMPEGTTPADVLRHGRAVTEAALTYGINLTLRQHILLWPDILRGK